MNEKVSFSTRRYIAKWKGNKKEINRFAMVKRRIELLITFAKEPNLFTVDHLRTL